MTIRVGPTIPEHIRTHHVSLTDRNGKSMGLILVDANGEPKFVFSRNPVDRTSFKTTSGSLAYSDFEYPYTPISQDNWAGGRGNLNFETDATRFIDSFRMRTSRSGRAFLGPQEQYTYGYRSLYQSVPGNVSFQSIHDSTRQVAVKVTTDADITGSSVFLWLLVRRVGEPADLEIRLKSDNAGEPLALVGTQTSIGYDVLDDVTSEWILVEYTATLSPSTDYWLELLASSDDSSTDHWEVGASASVGLTKMMSNAAWVGAGFDIYCRVTIPETEYNPILFQYDQQQYLVISAGSGAPKLYMNGDRGVADANTGTLDKLIDATKTWTADTLIGAVCVIIAGAGSTEDRPYRVIEDNTTTELIFTSDPWTVEQDTTTEYVIVGADLWYEMIGHGITAPVTDVLVATSGVVYFCQGDGVAIRRHRTYNNAGTWTNDWASEASNKATFMAYAPQAQKIWRANNVDASSVASVSSADVTAWGADLTFATAKSIGSKFERITKLEIYLDDDGVEALWVGKESRPWIVPTTANPYPLSLKEMENVRSLKNCKAMEPHNVYLYFSFMDGLEQYYDGNLSDIGPNNDEGLPENRQGAIVSLVGYPGKLFAAVDAGADGYSSVLVRDGGGWHEHYRGPLGQRIKGIHFQVIPGGSLNRLWVYQGNDLIWLPFPVDTTNELEDSDYLYTHEGVLELSRMHAGMMDTLKLVKQLKLMTDDLVAGEQWIEADYRIDTDTEWTKFPMDFQEGPVQEVSLADASQAKVTYGVAGKRLMLRLRFYTTDASKTPLLLALVLEVVSRITVKHLYSLPCRIADNDRDLTGQPDDLTADEKFTLLDEWIGDASSSLLLMRSIEKQYDNRLVFLQPYGDRTKNMAQTPEDGNFQNRTYLITLVAQDA